LIARLGASACETAGGGKQRAIGAERMAYNRARTHLALASRWSTKPALLSSAPCTVCGVEDVSSEHQPGGQWHGTDPMASMPKICAAYVYLGYARCIPRCSNRRPLLIAFLLPLANEPAPARAGRLSTLRTHLSNLSATTGLTCYSTVAGVVCEPARMGGKGTRVSGATRRDGMRLASDLRTKTLCKFRASRSTPPPPCRHPAEPGCERSSCVAADSARGSLRLCEHLRNHHDMQDVTATSTMC
jgi:hypothetical protein